MLFYSALFYLLLPFILLRLVWRGFKAPGYRQRWRERFGFVNKSVSLNKTLDKKLTRFWLHAVSLGEVVAAQPLVAQCLKYYPHTEFIITCSTPTGFSQIERAFGDNPRVSYCYAPYDLPDSVKRFLKRVQPDAFLIMETEIWPNMITQCHRQHIPVILINGRLSQRSFKRYRFFSDFSRQIFSKITTIFAQADQDAGFFKQLADMPVIVSGSVKSDIFISDELQQGAQTYRTQIEQEGKRSIIIAASTHKGEDEIILATLKQLREVNPDLLCILVPRHPERFDAVAELCAKQGFSIAKKSTNEKVSVNTDILLGDTIGDLLLMYGVADIAIVGGTFIDNGGHNFLEPAAWGLPIVSGTSDFNFSQIAKGLREKQALIQVKDAEQLKQTLAELLEQETVGKELGLAAKQYVIDQRGALEKVMKEIHVLLVNR